MIRLQGGKGRKDRDIMLSPIWAKLYASTDAASGANSAIWLLPGQLLAHCDPISPKVTETAFREAVLPADVHREVHPTHNSNP